MTEVDLTATTRRLDRDVDPLAVAGGDGVLFSRNRVGFAGRGVALRVGRSDVAEALAAIEVDDEVERPGSGPVGFTALPFLPGADADVVVPALLVGRDADGTRWVTAVGPTGSTIDPIATLDAHLAGAAQHPPPPGPGAFEVRASRAPAAWTDAVAEATARIRAGELDKVVLAREVVVTADAPIPVATVLLRLSQAYPDCFLYLVDGFCGASPELLVGRSADVVRAQPMAGTAPRRGDPAADARLAAGLLASATYRQEHQVTIDAVHDGLLAFASYVDYEPEPSVVPLANVQHLATNVEGRLSHPPASILELVEALHPTPAVCGRPRDAALRVIDELEALDRGRYAGAVGWVDAGGNGQFAVSIRGASIEGAVARVVAGNGLVGDSDPATELIETRAKLQAMLGAIVRP
ncbi:MAG: isochorismate synthase [Actinobacteria bacterium]|nr:isochorismate synthase [Actinomycetota bacterium]